MGETGAVPKLQPVDDAFFSTAPIRAVETFRIARPAAEVWAELTSEKPADWCRVLSIRWTSPRPFAVGTTRRAKVLGGAITIDEHFYRFDEGHRMTFYVTKANVPLFRRLAEDYLVEPDGDDACTFTWQIVAETSTIGKAGTPVNALLFKSIFADTRKHFGTA